MDSLTRHKRRLEALVLHGEPPHYYELTREGKLFRHCGTIKDVLCVLDIYPDCYWKKCYPHIPQTVDVAATTVEEKALPESDLLELNI